MGIKFRMSQGLPLSLVLIYLLILAGIFISASYFYQYQKNTIELHEKNLFIFVSNLKLQQIVTWRDERLSDANRVLSNEFIINGLDNFFNNYNNLPLKAKLTGWINSLTQDRNYESVFLLNNRHQLILGSSLSPKAPDNYVMRWSDKASSDDRPLLSDFHRDSISGNACLYLFVPVKTTSYKKLVIVFKINPYSQLYPLLQSWPIPTQTAETIMVENRRDSILSLSPLKRIKNAELKFRLPVAYKDLPAAKYLHGETGLIYGRDYKQIDVAAYGQYIPSTPWLLITKIDTAELFANIKGNALFVISLALLFLFVVTLGFWYFIMKQKKYFRQLLYRTVEDKKTLEKNNEFLIKYANDVMFLLNETGNIIFSNERAAQVYGYTQEELLKLNLSDIRDESQHQLVNTQMELAGSPGGIVFETLHKKKSGAIFPVEVSSRKIEVHGKIYLQSIIRDITERRESERKIYELNRTYSFLSDVNQMIVRVHNENELFEETSKIAISSGGFKYAWIGMRNKSTGNLEVAASAGECNLNLDNHTLDYYDPELKKIPAVKCLDSGRHYIINDIENNVYTKRCIQCAKLNNYESLAVFPLINNNKAFGTLSFYSDKKNFFTEAEIKLLDEMSGDVSYAVKYLKNERKRKKSEKALMKNWERYREFFENNPRPMWIYDENSLKFIDVNKTAVKHYGYSKEEFLSMTIRDIRPGEDVAEIINLLGSGTEEIRTFYNIRHRKKDGTIIFVEVKSNVISLEQKKRYRIVSINDITEQKKIMEEMIVAKEKAEEANKARNVFLGTMSHELRTPLIGVLGYSDILLDDLHSGEQVEMVKGIIRGGRRLLNTLNLILDFTRIESDRLEVILKKDDIVEPITYAFSEFEGAAKEKDLEYTLNILEPNLICNFDEHLFIIIIENLINNAIKFTRQGSITVTAGINSNNNIFISISDTGIGIDKKHIDIIFEEFRQVSEGINREYQGTGLGLTITEKYIRMHNGSIKVESAINKGSTFTITLPRADI